MPGQSGGLGHEPSPCLPKRKAKGRKQKEPADPENLWKNHRMFRRVPRREELFDGPAVDRMPDVIAEVNDYAFRLRSGLGLDRVFVPFRKKKSYHAPEGIFYVRGPGIKAAQRIDDVDIQDAAPFILYLMGLHKLSTMDGRLPSDTLDRAFFEGC